MNKLPFQVLLLCIAIAFSIFAFQVRAASNAPKPKRVTISDLIDHDDDYYDQRLVVSGVLFNGYWGPKLCEFRRHRPKDDEQCIDMTGPRLPFEQDDESFTGAVVEVVGYFGDTCKVHDPPPPSQANSDSVVEMVCTDRGGSGWISVESAKIIGADLECQSASCGATDTSEAREVTLAPNEAQRLREFVTRLVESIQHHDEHALLALTPSSLRTRTAWYLKVDGGRSSRSFFPPEIANASNLIARPGSGYRLFDVAERQSMPAHQQVCFCASGTCGNDWSRALDEHVGYMRRQFRCLYVARAPTGWRWIY